MRERRLSCRQLLDVLDRYLDGELAPAELERFEAHLRACPECVDYLHSYQKTVRLSGAAWADAEPVPADVPPALIQAILAAARAREAPRAAKETRP